MKVAFAATVSVAALLCSTSAFAQGAPAAGPEVSQLQEVVVTARRREESLQDVPVAVTAFSGETLQRAGVQRLDDLPRVTPGFVLQASPYGNAAPTPTLRSQRQPLTNLSYDPSVNIYFAEVVLERAHGLNSGLYDLSSIQVLKGPQGTLFGRNATGGALLITPQAPGPDFGGYVRGTIGNYNLKQVEGAINIPLGEMLQLRVAGRVVDRDGYQRSLTTGLRFDNEQTEAYRVSLRGFFGPVTNTLVLDGNNDHSQGQAYRVRDLIPGSIAATALRLGPEVARLQGADIWDVTTELPNDGIRQRTFTASNITEWEVNDDITVKNIFGYREVSSRLRNDLDGASVLLIDNYETLDVEQFSEELQLQGTAFNKTLNYIVGAYAFRENGRDTQVTRTLGTPSTSIGQMENTSVSVFAQATYQLPFLEGLSATAGLRNTKDERSLDANSFRLGACLILTADVGGVPVSPCAKRQEASSEQVTYNLSLDWKINENNMVYVATRRGYRSAGITWTAKLPSEFTPFRPETVTDYEVGLKSTYDFLGGQGRTNIAAYYQDYTDIQRNLNVFTPGPNGVPFVQSSIINAASATIPGFEIEQYLQPVPWLELSLSYAYSDPGYDVFFATGQQGLADYSGAPLAGAPKHTVNGLVRVELPIPEAYGRLFFQVNGSYQSETVAQDVQSYNPITKTIFPTSYLPSYSVGNMRADWQGAFGRPIDVSLFVKNFTNEEYWVAGNDISALGVSGYLSGKPRTYGLEVNYKF